MRLLQSEPNLAAELAIGISRRLRHICGTERMQEELGLIESSIHHNYMTDFERGCDVLWRLGVASGYYGATDDFGMISYTDWTEGRLSKKKKTWPPYFRFLSAPDIRTRLLGWVENELVTIVELMGRYLAVACDYGRCGSYMPTSRMPFQPQDEYLDEISALMYYGYVHEASSGVVWSDKIGDAMHAASFWSEDHRCLSEINEIEFETEARLAWETMPPMIKKAYFSKRPLDVVGITKLLIRGWKDGEWDLSDADKPIILAGELSLAIRLVEIANNKQ